MGPLCTPISKRRRSEVVERSFAHICETGGGRRSWLRGIDEVRKRHLMAATAHNLGLVLRKLLGSGKVREFAALWARVSASVCVLLRRLPALTRLIARFENFVSQSPTNSTADLLAV